MILESAAVPEIIDLEWQKRCAFSLYFLCHEVGSSNLCLA